MNALNLFLRVKLAAFPGEYLGCCGEVTVT